MITFVRTVQFHASKLVEAIALAKEIAAHVNGKHGMNLSVSMPIGGNPHRLSWVGTVGSLSEYEQYMGKAMSDPDFFALLKRASDITLPGTTHDEMWRTL